MTRILERGGRVVIIEADSDPGDIGEPREFSEDGTEYVVVPSWEDAALGAAWRRAEAALPEGWQLGVMNGLPHSAWAYGGGEVTHEGEGPTPTAALEALAAKLESL